jgi:hypothetical protein
MKNEMLNKEANYSLSNPDNYKKSIDCSISLVAEKYVDLMIDYYKFICDSINLKNSSHSKFIIIRGLDTLTNVFFHILSSTKNIELTYFHCQKSFYFYVEFVGQISDDEKTFLQLSSRDATTYVYKKTIFDINQDHRKPNNSEHNDKYKKIGHFINIFQTYLVKIINANTNLKENDDYINQMKDLCIKVISSSNKVSLPDLERITEKIYAKIEGISLFLDVNYQVIKKASKNSSENIKIIEKKMDSEEFYSKINDPIQLDNFLFC